MRTVTFDVECWDLSPEFAPLCCASALDNETGEMTTLLQVDYVMRGLAHDTTDDRALLVDLRDLLDQYHLRVGWNHLGFDLPLVNTRLAKWGEALLSPSWVYDGMWACRGWHGIKPKSSKLKHVAEFFGLEEEKPEVGADTWLKARVGDPEALTEVVDRCEADVRITAEVTTRLLDMGLGAIKRRK